MESPSAAKTGWLMRAVSVVAGLAATIAVASTARDYGFAIDEATYLWVAREVRVWFSELPTRNLADSFSSHSIAERWHFLESPFDRRGGQHSNFNLPVGMHVMNVGWLVSHRFLNELHACRFGPALLLGFTVAATCHGMGRRYGLPFGVLSAVLLIACPRLWGHSHLAATETPLFCFWILAHFALLDAVESRSRWSMACFASALGLLFATKVTGWLVVVPFGMWLTMTRPKRFWSVVVPAAAGISLIVYVATPPLWREPIEGVLRLVRLSVSNPWQIPSVYFGTAYGRDLPWHSGIAIFVCTMPLATLLLGVVGAFRCKSDATARLFALSACSLLMARTLGLMPTHDVDRQFIPLYATWCCLAALGAQQCVNLLTRAAFGKTGDGSVYWSATGLALASSLAIEPLWETWQYRSHGLSYYNRILGGLEGADRAGMEVSYWFEAATDDIWIAALAKLPVGSRVFLRPDHPGLDYLMNRGIWRADLKSVGPEEADFFLLYARKAAYAVANPETGKFQLTDLLFVQSSEPAIWEPPRFRGVRFLALFRRR